MKIRFASALLALTLPLCAQEPVAAEAETLFYKAFYLEKGPRDFAGAMALYDQFLAKAPEHKLAGEAAKQQFALLDRTGKTKERDAFKAKYEKLLGSAVAVASTGGAAPAAGDAPRGAGRGAGAGPGAGVGRVDPAARLAELEKQLAKAKEEGNEEEVKRLTQQIERAKQMGERGARGAGGQAGPGGGRGMPGMRALFGNTKLADMSAEEMTQLKESVGAMEGVPEMMRERLTEEQTKKFETSLAALKKGLADNKLEDAQKAIDEMKTVMPQRRRGGGGEAGGAGGGGGGGRPAGGGGGTNGGGGGGGGGR